LVQGYRAEKLVTVIRTCFNLYSFKKAESFKSIKGNLLTYTNKLIAAYGLVACTASTFAQCMPHDPVQNVAQLSASGSVEVQQDLLSISMNTTRDGADAGAVQNQLRQALDTALTQAKTAAAPELMDVRTGNFSLHPRYGKDGKINGWQGAAELVLEGRDFSRITSTAGKIQSLTMGNVSFALSRGQRAKVESQAQSLAIDRFKVKADEISRSFGFSSYALREVSVSASDQGYSPRPQAMSMAKAEMPDSSLPVEAGKSTVLVNVSGSVQMK
jgi:predicted secreted protein